jgi:hypothetical protein
VAFKKSYPVETTAQEEVMTRVTFELTTDGDPCQIHVQLGSRTDVQNPGSMPGTFAGHWDEVAPTAAQFQKILDAVRDLTAEERAPAIPGPVEPI